MTAASLGHYAVAVTAGTSLALIGTSVGMVTFPRIAAEPSLPQPRRVVRRAIGFTASASAIVGAVIVVAADPIVNAIYGADYADAVPLARILALGGVAISVAAVAGDALRGLDRVGLVAAPRPSAS